MKNSIAWKAILVGVIAVLIAMTITLSKAASSLLWHGVVPFIAQWVNNEDQATPVRISTLLPSFKVITLQGDIVDQEAFQVGPYVFVFVVPNCKACENLTKFILSVYGDDPKIHRFVFVTRRDSKALQDMLQPLVEQGALVLLDREDFLAYPLAVEWAPTVGLFNDGLLIQMYTNPGNLLILKENIDQLLQGQLQPNSPLSLTAGEPLPALTFQNLKGQIVQTPELERPFLLVFGDNECTATRTLLPQLEEALSMGISVYLILLNKESSLQTSIPILLDPALEAANHFGIPALPVLIWVNAKGVITWIQVGAHKDLLEVLRILQARNKEGIQ